MLPNNFESIAAKHPELEPQLAEISEWIKRHRDWTILDPRVLASDLGQTNIFPLSRALGVLVSSGLFKTVYKLVGPMGSLIPDNFEDPESIPEVIYDRWDRPVETGDLDLIAVLSSARETEQAGYGV